MPSRARLWRASRVMSRPSKAIRPAVGRKPPATRRKSVLLPAPFGPIRPWRSPSSRSRSTPSTARSPPNATLSIAQLEHAHAAVRHQRARASRPAKPPGNRYTERMNTSPSSSGPCPPSETPISSRT